MLQPVLDEVRSLANSGNLLPVYREILADLETPVSAYLKVASGPGSFLLESVEGGERQARYSFIGASPHAVVTLDNGRAWLQREGRTEEQTFTDPLDVIRHELVRHRPIVIPELPAIHGGVVGYLSYECVRYFERLPVPERDPLGLPEAVVLFADTLLVFDHLRHRIKVVAHARLDGDIDASYRRATNRIEEIIEQLRQPVPTQPTSLDGQRSQAKSNLTQEEFQSMVSRARRYISDGDAIQVVLSQRLARRTPASSFSIYRALRTINPSPYMYYLRLGDCDIVGASPELLVKVEDGIVSTRPLAGTRRRGADDRADLMFEQDLRADEKERAEHIMLVDLGRNDLGRVSEPGSVEVTQLMDVERYSHVMHLVSNVQGKLRAGLDQFDALRSCFPAGTVSGAPKVRAMEIIAELERDRRGPYAGAIGNFSYSGNLDTAITIRTIVVKDGVAHFQVGAGIVADSVPELEHQETLNKAGAMLQAIDIAEDGLG